MDRLGWTCRELPLSDRVNNRSVMQYVRAQGHCYRDLTHHTFLFMHWLPFSFFYTLVHSRFATTPDHHNVPFPNAKLACISPLRLYNYRFLLPICKVPYIYPFFLIPANPLVPFQTFQSAMLFCNIVFLLLYTAERIHPCLSSHLVVI